MVSGYRLIKIRVFAIVWIATVAVIVAVLCVQVVPKAAIFDQPPEITYGPGSSDLVERSGGLICYDDDQLMSSADHFWFQALYFRVGRYSCIHRYGVWKHTVRAVLDPSAWNGASPLPA
jgi:hypothetical protein